MGVHEVLKVRVLLIITLLLLPVAAVGELERRLLIGMDEGPLSRVLSLGNDGEL